MSTCPHTEWKSEVMVGIPDNPSEGYKVDLQVFCAACFKPLQFVGMNAGIHPVLPTVSVSGLEARLNAKLLS